MKCRVKARGNPGGRKEGVREGLGMRKQVVEAEYRKSENEAEQTDLKRRWVEAWESQAGI